MVGGRRRQEGGPRARGDFGVVADVFITLIVVMVSQV